MVGRVERRYGERISMSGGEFVGKLTIADLPGLIASVAAVDATRTALNDDGTAVDYATLHRELDTLATSMGGVLGPDAVFPIVLSNLAPGLLGKPGGLEAVVETLISDAMQIVSFDRPDAGSATLASRFDARVARTPDAIALTFGDDILTYAEFDAQANRLARFLIGRGVGPDKTVALAISRSCDLLVGMYAIVKAGGAYVPLDPEQPAERNAYVLDTAAPICVLSTERDDFTADDIPVVAIDALDLGGYSEAPVTDSDRLAPLRPDNLAYVIFTSGSTGRPKGVAVAHAAIVNNLDWRQSEYGFDESDAILQKTPFTFDVSVWEFFWPLQVGARLVIAEPGGHRDPSYLARTMISAGVTVAHFVPSMLAVFVSEPAAADIPQLRYVFASGEALPAQTAARLREISSAGLHNLYGPTEAAVDVTYYETGERDETSIPIGAAVANTELLVLDDGLRPVATGIPGELYLAGAQLARGYVARPDLTADRFVARPGGKPGERMYRTGDLVRWRGSGEDQVLDYIGRTDFQVKLRGLRIELGEIESALLDCDGVAQSAVLVQSHAHVGDRLVAYVVTAPGASVDPAALSAALAKRLPDYMVPQLYVALASFPLNASGKLDRKALPAPEIAAVTVDYRAPSTDTEAALVKVFAELLGVDKIGVDDDFFALGGNSLIATRAVARVNAELVAALEVRDFFDASTAAGFAATVDRVIAEGGSRVARPPLEPQERPDRVPLSLAQQRMWFLNRLDPGSAVDNVPMAIRLSGKLDLPALQAAVADLVGRHEVLHTIYPDVDGVGYQQLVDESVAVPDLAPISVSEADLVAAATAVVSAGFDVTQEVPIRASLFQTGEQEYVLALVIHHITGDGFSMGPLMRDFLAAYWARTSGEPPMWQPLLVQYADFALWQRKALGVENDPESVLFRQIEFWRTSLAGSPERLDLPMDRPRPPVASGRGASYRIELSRAQFDHVAMVARAHAVTEFMVVHAALAVTLAKLSGTADIVIGTPVAGRGDAGLDDLVGMFVNTLALRTEVASAATISELIDQVREVDLAAFSHADVPFERLVDLIDPVRSQAWSPIFQVMLTFQNFDETTVEMSGLHVAPVDLDIPVAKFDLQVTLAPTELGCTVDLTYAADLFDEPTIIEFAARFARVLDSVTTDTSKAIGAVSIIDARERSLVLDEWNRTAHGVVGESLAELFDAQVARTPDAVAVVFADAELSYAEFDARVNRLARHLITLDIGPEMLVGLAIRRSVDLLVAMYAIVKAGAAYVPIDPDQPAERNAYVLEIAQPRCVVTTERDGFEGAGDRAHVTVFADTVDVAGHSAAPVRDAERTAPLRPESPAYVIFTSGSTGRPKGVAVTHAAIVNRLVWMQAEYDLTTDDVVLQKTPFTFDVSVWEFFWPLQIGARLVVAVPDGHRDPEYLARLIRSASVSVTHFVPSMLEVFLAEPAAKGCPSLRLVFASGEALPPAVARRAREALPQAALHNLYGPTEAAVEVTYHHVTAQDAVSIPIGRPVWNTEVRVLDAWLQPVPVGVPGELYLAGVQLARGYVARPDLTADRFVADPFATDGARLYRTGDLVRWKQTGELEYIGRTDFQVKLRGLRIELGEIESALRRYDAVGGVVVVVWQDQLVAYLTADTDAGLDTEELRTFATQWLPAYMVPSVFVVLEALPLNASGKLDRRALPEPVVRQREFRAARTPIEEIVATIFADVLGVARVGLDDNFFALGGNSLSATQVVSRIARATETAVPLRLLFDTASVEALAARLENHVARRPHAPLVAQERPKLIPLSLAQQRMWFLSRFDSASAVNNIPIALRMTGALHVAALQAAVHDVVGRHEILRTVYPETDGQGYQAILAPSEIVLDLTPEHVDETQLLDRIAELLLAGFDVTAEVPVRIRLLQTSPTDYVLVLVVHHIAIDGFSMAPLTRDVMAAYAARLHDSAPMWPRLSVQYADFAIWQREVLGAEGDPESLLAQQLFYWKGQLAELPERLELPTDHPRPRVASNRGATYRFVIDAATHDGIQALAKEHESTAFMVVHSALAILLARLSATTDIAIGTPVAGRGEAELDDLVGMFVNTLVLRTQVDLGASFVEILAAARDTDLDAFGHADVPFERLVEVLSPARSQAHHPLFQVALFFQNMNLAQIDLPDLSVAGLETGVTIAKFDLQFTFAEDAAATQSSGMLAEIAYATDLFDESTVAALADRLQRVFAAILADPDRAAGEIELLEPDERSELLVDRNATEHAVDPDATLVSLFADRVEEIPDSIAIIADAESLTFRELAAKVNTLARHLVGVGVGPETLVALAMRRSIDLVVGMYAVEAAGGAYVPLDPEHPADRIEHILDTAQPICLLTTATDGFSTEATTVIAIDTLDLAEVSDAGLTDVDRRGPLRPDNSAYVIFTSGSTGRPKGVAVTHQAIVNQVRWMQEEYGFSRDDVYLQKTATTFDVSLWGYFVALTAGTPVVLASADGHRDPAYLADLIVAHRVTLTDFVPSMLTVFVGSVPSSALETLRGVFVIGEALPVETARAFAASSSAGLHNVYGPTEAAVSITFHEFGAADTGVVPIGVPEWNSQVYVLDSRLRPVADGVTGELYLAGTQLARGYLSRPDLTSDRFVADPFGPPGSRAYRTGDLVRWNRHTVLSGRSAGSAPALEYIGRTDFQVKFRGQRIELGEIESVLLADDAVAQTVAIVMSSGTGDNLVGYLVASPGSEIDLDRLRTSARANLPAYMVPGAFVVLDELPLNTSGKLDRKALPAPTFEARTFRAPSTPVEEAVASVFVEVLGVSRVGADDDFFELGGNSLIATQAATRLGVALNARVPVRDLFEAPTVEALAVRVETKIGSGSRAPLTARPRPEHVPLSLAQQRMWFLNRFDIGSNGASGNVPASAAYNIPMALKLSGALDVAALQHAVRDVVGRHEILRTVYPEVDGVGYQRVLAASEVPIDLTPVSISEAGLLGSVVEFVSVGFDVAAAVPLRTRLFQLGAADFVLVVVVHHIAGDAYSFGPLARDVMTAYLARSAGELPAWSPLKVQYADFALWQREVLGDEDTAESLVSRQIEHWQAALAGVPSQLDLPADRPRPAVASNRGATYRFTIDALVQEGLNRIAREQNATPFMAAHAALAVLLARLSATHDITVGTPVAGRGEQALDDLVGMFVNTLVLRTEVDPADSFVAVLARAREVDLEAFGNADVPFERLVDALDPERSRARHPLFQVMLTFQNLAPTTFELPGLTVSSVEADVAVAKFDLQVTLAEAVDESGSASGISAELIYAIDLFDESTIADFAHRFVRVVQSVVADPTKPIGEIDLLDGRERVALLDEWQRSGAAVDPTTTLVDLFERSVDTFPERPAVRFDAESLSYSDLGRRVHKLARRLIEAGVGPESMVAVALPRSADLIIALQAVLQAGGAYLPVDPTYPADRIEYMLGDAKPTCVISWSDRDTLLPNTIPVIDIDAVDLSGFSDAPLTSDERRRPIHPSNVAYVIYTSGSTGRPKGVTVSHRNVVELLANAQLLFDFDHTDVWTLFHSYAFDFSVWEMWGPLAFGGTAIVVDYTTSRSPDQFRELVARENVTVLNQTPSAFYQFVEADRAAGQSAASLSLRWVVFGGEALELRRLSGWFDRHGDSSPRLVNMYGITETTVHVSFLEVSSAAAKQAASIIGRGLPGLRLYVLDERLGPVPVGVRGDLYVAGDQLSRGYLGRPELTFARFIPDPFGTTGARMYRTGDVARWNRAGLLEYAGRSDSQVQLRGFRIELGEIESALLRFDGVANVVAVVLTAEHIGDRLVAYIVPKAGVELDATRVLEFASTFLTGYMVPDAVVTLDELPLTANGKLDRKALPAPVFESKQYRIPETPTEEAVASVFAEVLGVARVGGDDDFFELGGNSLAATKVVARLGHALNVGIPVRALFEDSSVRGLAATIDAQEGEEARAPLVARERPARTPLSLAQQRMWLVNQLDPDSAVYNIPLALRVIGKLDVLALQAAVRDIFERHETLRTMYPSDADGPYQQILQMRELTSLLEVIDVEADSLHDIVVELLVTGFDVAAGVPVRTRLLQLGSEEYVFVLVAHHIAADGASMAPLARDMVLAYMSRAHGAEPPFTPMDVQYADYTLWQREVIGSEDESESRASRQAAYWKENLAGLPTDVGMPADHARSGAPTMRGESVQFEVDETVFAKLGDLAREHRATIFMVVHAALAVLVSRLGGGNDFAIGTPVAGRGERELDEMVGMFVNTLTLRSQVDPNASFAEMLAQTRATDIAAFANADLPFERVVELATGGGAQRQLFQTVLSMDPVAEVEFDLGGLEINSLGSAEVAAKFDLQLTLSTSPNNGSIQGNWVYSTDLFERSSVELIASRFALVLEAVTADPNQRVGSIEILTTDERRQLLAAAETSGSTDTSENASTEWSGEFLASLFARAVEDDPQAPAVVVDGSEVTYEQLDDRSSRLARALIRDGVGPGDYVGMPATSSVESLVVMWAIVKTGAAIVCIEPSIDREAIDLLVEAGTLKAAVSASSALQTALAGESGRPVTYRDRLRPQDSSDIAFAVLTSAVPWASREVRHGELVSLLTRKHTAYELNYDSSVLCATTATGWAVTVGLLAGLAGAAIVQSPIAEDDIIDVISTESVTHAFLGSALLKRLSPEECPALQTVVLIGTTAADEELEKWTSHATVIAADGEEIP